MMGQLYIFLIQIYREGESNRVYRKNENNEIIRLCKCQITDLKYSLVITKKGALAWLNGME